MAIINFDILIAAGENGSYALRVLESTHGRTDSPVRYPLADVPNGFNFSPADGSPPLFVPPNLDDTVIDALPADVTWESIGGSLYNALIFDNRVQDILGSAIGAARANGDRIRIRFQVEPGALRRLAFELMHRTPEGFLSLAADFSITRYVAVEGLPIRTLVTPPPLKVLIVTASPSNLPALNVDAEIARVRQAVQPMLDAGYIEIHELRDPSLTTLRSTLRAKEIAVLHFIGHGDFSGTTPVLALTKPDKTAHAVDAETFAVNLAGVDSLRLAFLNACDSAIESTTIPLLGIAPKLMQRANLPAVIAMSAKISDGSAIAFSEALYGALARGGEIDDAIREGRIAIFNRQQGKKRALTREFALPVLFLRPASAQLIDFPERQNERIVAAVNTITAAPEMRTQIQLRDQVRRQLSALSNMYTRIANWKTLHDILQTLEGTFDLVEKEVNRAVSTPEGDLNLVFSTWTLCQTHIEKLKAFASDPRTAIVVTPFVESADGGIQGDPWSASIVAAALRFDTALNSGDESGLRRTARALRLAVQTHLNMSDKAILDVNRDLAGITLKFDGGKSDAENELRTLHRRLDERVMIHDMLQDLTNAFRRVRDETTAPAALWDAEDIQTAWDYTRASSLDSRLIPFATSIGALNLPAKNTEPRETGGITGEPFMVELYTLGERIDRALELVSGEAVTAPVNAAFVLSEAVRAFDTALRRHYFLADKALNDLTTALLELAGKLANDAD